MKNIIDFLLAMVILGVMTSCSQDGDTIIDPPTPSHINDNTVSHIENTEVSESDALDVAMIFNVNRFGTTASRSSQDVEVITNKTGQPIAYIVNNDGGGWVIVSATTKYHPILAYSDDATNRFNLSSGLSNTGLGIWVDEIAADIETSASFDENTSTQIAAEWSALLHAAEPMAGGIPTGNSAEAIKCRTRLKELNEMYYTDGWTFTTLPNVTDATIPSDVYTTADNVGSAYEYTIVGLKDVSFRSEIGPLLKTTWYQAGYCSNSANAGCVPIAIGQIMKYHEYPTYFEWDRMPNNYASETTIAFIDRVRSALDMKANDEGASLGKASDAFRYFGYIAQEKDYSLSEVCLEIGSKRPVYMHGKRSLTAGHAWVCDGMIKKIGEYQYYVEYLNSVTEYTNYGLTLMNNPGSCAGASYTRLHMNWGWGGNYDGWYLSPTPPGKDYSSDRKDIYLRPNQ